MPKSKNIGDKLFDLRVSRRLTQFELAKACNISQAQVARYENGVNKPTQRVLGKICDGLGITMDYFKEDVAILVEDSLDREYFRAKNAITDPEDMKLLSRLLQGFYLVSQSKIVLGDEVVLPKQDL